VFSIPFDESKSFVGFGDQDVVNLMSLANLTGPMIPEIVARFYQVILAHSETRSVFTEGEAQVIRLKRFFQNWLQGLFGGSYDDSYLQSRRRIGETHVRIGLAQRYMPLAMELVWAEFNQRLRAIESEGIDAKLQSLHKLLILDLTIMLSSYQESYAEEIRRFEHRALEVQLERSRHLAEIGQLAATLAHEVKNPLAGISGAIQIIGESMPKESPYKTIIQAILGQISRLDATVKDLLLYARPSPTHRNHVRLGHLVERTINLLREEPAMQRVRVQCHGSDLNIEADEGQLEQLLINLFLNAAQASPPDSTILVEIAVQGELLQIMVKDHGTGMPRAIKDRALEPFFTTKSKGTGLGLAICRRIVESHGGTISIESSPGAGTTVTISLPRISEVSEAEEL
jgi:signal transduction histidine kinase